ncbi:Response regulator/GGDEF domain protein [Thermodesulfovibrio sp. N1]|nr:Response regulator/GGDEF domain protein [Thermodesulfovibrio sp. N1]
MRDLLKHFPGVVFIDPLTGLNNRIYLDILKLKIEKSKMKICIFMIDIDNFKRINDEYGHSVGDIVLKNVAKTLKSNIKGFDEVIRYGGEEFLVILYRCEINHIYNIAERLRKKVKQIKIPKYESINTTVSIGAYSYEPGEDIDEAIKKADIAMYQAKKAGKDRVSIYGNQ